MKIEHIKDYLFAFAVAFFICIAFKVFNVTIGYDIIPEFLIGWFGCTGYFGTLEYRNLHRKDKFWDNL